jgi:hypothetical protein
LWNCAARFLAHKLASTSSNAGTALPIFRLLERGAYEPGDIEILTEAFEEALRLAGVEDRTTVAAEMIAQRVIAQFEKGETDPKRIAERAVASSTSFANHPLPGSAHSEGDCIK